MDRSEPGAPIEVSLVELSRVLPTEAVNPEFVDTLAAGIEVAGVWTHPLLLEEDSLAVLDGHHRLAAARRIGLSRIPAVRVSYSNPRVHLESWRAGMQITPAEVIRRARSGELLPCKSTRHVTDFVLPQVGVPIAALRGDPQHGTRVARAGHHPTRSMMLVPAYHRLCARLRIRPDTASKLEVETPETQAPHAQLRRTLQSDPAMVALLPAAPGRLVLGGSGDAPFLLKRTGLLCLPPGLLGSPSALSIATRWGLEALHFQSNGLLAGEALAGLARHGRSLLRTASVATVDAILESVPPAIADELRDPAEAPPSAGLLAWQRTRIEALADGPGAGPRPEVAACELWNCVEELLVAGGDSRIAVDRRTGFNRYGTTPRPRPEAVHFSSSTASSISDYGFAYCDMLRRDLLAAMLREELAPGDIRARAVDAFAAELLDLLALDDVEADVVVAPSGTDTEMLAVLLALAAGQPLTNVLIAPEESGRGIPDAAAGRYFDGIGASGQPLPKGKPAWPEASVRTVSIPIRDADGAPCASAAVAARLRTVVAQALARGERVLLHFLASSKTGLDCPGDAAIAELAALDPRSIDVVVDACQMRSPFATLGDWARRGWLVQLTGSKFLTGPPFSGALVVPRALRDRAARVGGLLDAAPGVGSKRDWPEWWRGRWAAPDAAAQPSFGPVFRWLPALLEAQLYKAVPDAVKESCFRRFRRALAERLGRSAWLLALDARDQGSVGEPGFSRLAVSSIVCFAVQVGGSDGGRRVLGEDECRRIFQLLNLDLGAQLGQLSPAESACASLQAHIGQPVVLRSREHPMGIGALRMVLGARFFSIVAHAGPGSVEAALESEISDAIRALEKLELLARLWNKASRIAL